MLGVFVNVFFSFLPSGVHLFMSVVCVVLLFCSACWPFAHCMLCAALFYRCSCFLKVSLLCLL